MIDPKTIPNYPKFSETPNPERLGEFYRAIIEWSIKQDESHPHPDPLPEGEGVVTAEAVAA